MRFSRCSEQVIQTTKPACVIFRHSTTQPHLQTQTVGSAFTGRAMDIFSHYRGYVRSS